MKKNAKKYEFGKKNQNSKYEGFAYLIDLEKGAIVKVGIENYDSCDEIKKYIGCDRIDYMTGVQHLGDIDIFCDEEMFIKHKAGVETYQYVTYFKGIEQPFCGRLMICGHNGCHGASPKISPEFLLNNIRGGKMVG